ncbi:sulfotransferase [Streptomyces sp. R302]|uniref:sulfotransferase family protein n=1 Tax=unclassified Streptomyces TaxID=2593676 RepID=UPI00145E7EC5|nr:MULTISPECIES: sulfotransferase [unclassified Streptomyces]NML53865.1 sulfotransferase [Streptomyces sp. R301]NML83124.1 sulfotransferase [Streptomyces sp. R302]
MSSSPLALTLADLLVRPAFGSRRDPDRVFDGIAAAAGQAPGDRQFVDDFRSLLGWWAKADGLTPVGWQSAQTHVRRHLTNRARVRRLIAEHPEIEREPIEKPVFVVGLPRTATTVTHSVLSISDEHRCPRLWELLTPDLDLPPRQRRKAVTAGRRLVQGADLFAPRFRDIHAMAAEGPEECTFALPHALMPFAQARLPEYRNWHCERDFVPDYRYLKQVYQVLQYGRPRRRWMLKSPMHLENLDALRTVFPDAVIVWCHRDPVTALASYCSLVEHGMAISTRPLDLEDIGATWLGLLSRAMARGLAARADIPPEQLVDAPYSWLGSDPATGAPKLYAAVGAPWTEADAARLPAAVARPKGARKHTYDLSRYGLSRSDVESAFAEYDALRAEVDPA